MVEAYFFGEIAEGEKLARNVKRLATISYAFDI